MRRPQPVVAAIVTSARGILAGRRVDGSPRCGFISGEIEPGESPADAATREVKEETGLLVRPGRTIGRRIHPRAGRLLIYVDATPEHGTEVHVGDRAELAEVRWLSLAEADDLLPGMFGPVRVHLEQVLIARQSGRQLRTVWSNDHAEDPATCPALRPTPATRAARPRLPAASFGARGLAQKPYQVGPRGVRTHIGRA